jgi:hypothetical protein
MAKHLSTTKSPIALAKQATTTAQQVVPPYSDTRSRHDFTQLNYLPFWFFSGSSRPTIAALPKCDEAGFYICG